MIYQPVWKLVFFLITFSLSTLDNALNAQSYQHDIDSLKFLLEQKPSDQQDLVKLYNDIAFAYRRASVDSMYNYIQLAISASKANNDKNGLVVAYKNLGIYQNKTGAPKDTVLNTFKIALAYAEKIDDFRNQAALYSNIGLSIISQRRYRESILWLLKGLSTLAFVEDPPPYLEGILNGNLGISYYNMENHELAYQHFSRVNEIAQKTGTQKLISIYAENYGNLLIDMGKVEEGLQYMQDATILQEEIGDIHSLIETKMVIAHHLINKNQFQAAEKQIHEVKEMTNSEHGTYLTSRLHALLGQIANGKGEHLKAIRHADTLLDLTLASNEYFYQNTSYQIKSESYQELGNYQLAFEMLQKKMRLKDSVDQTENKIIVEGLENHFMITQKEQEIIYLHESKKQKNTTIKILIALIIVGSTLLFFVYKASITSKKNEHVIKEKNQQLEKYIDQNLQLENFAYIASHDLKTPLRNIISFSQLLEKKLVQKDDPQIRSYLHFITNGSKELMALTQDLLDYSTLNNKELHRKQFRIDQLVDDCLHSLQSIISQANAELEVNIAPVLILADPIKLRQVFQNLILNAIKFHPKGVTPIVKIKMIINHDHWEFVVRDQGIGIESKFQEKIFLLLQRLHNKTEYEGTGMGLAIAKQVVEQHGGRIWVNSEIDKGSAFHFTIFEI